MNSIEVFKTNVKRKKDAQRLASALHSRFPKYKINFDMDDCDRILRVETRGEMVNAKEIMKVMKKEKVLCEVLNY
jgi:hypothetical protein